MKDTTALRYVTLSAVMPGRDTGSDLSANSIGLLANDAGYGSGVPIVFFILFCFRLILVTAACLPSFKGHNVKVGGGVSHGTTK